MIYVLSLIAALVLFTVANYYYWSNKSGEPYKGWSGK